MRWSLRSGDSVARQHPCPRRRGLSVLQPRAIVYDCMDELAAFRHAPARLREREAALLRVADVVFTGGPSLYEARRDRHPNVLCELPRRPKSTGPASTLVSRVITR